MWRPARDAPLGAASDCGTPHAARGGSRSCALRQGGCRERRLPRVDNVKLQRGTQRRAKMHRKKTNAVVAFITFLMAFAVAISNAAAADPPKQYVLKFNHVLAPTDPYHPALLKWARAVSARTNGNLKIEVFPSAQLGVEEDILEQIRQGANVGQNTDAARLGTYVKEMQVMNGPYFVETLEEVQKLNALPIVKSWKEQLERTQGFKVLSFYWVQGFRQTITNKPIKKPADLAGLRIRTPPAPIWQESVRAIGASPVAMAYGEMYTAMQTQAIDGAELSFTAASNGKFFEVAKYVSETRHILLINFEVISSKWFNALPADYQKILEEECDKAGLEVSRDYLENIDVKSRKLLQDKGMTVVSASDIDMAAFRAAGEAAYQKLGITATRDKVYQELGKKK
jgi:tripartite ATP-independent transporter DctP family solute receptor